MILTELKDGVADAPALRRTAPSSLRFTEGQNEFFDLLSSLLPWPGAVTAPCVPCTQPLALPGQYMVIWLKKCVKKITIF